MTKTRATPRLKRPPSPFIGISRGARGQFVAVAGTAPLDAEGRTFAPGDAAAQARRCFEIVARALEELGARLSDVVRTRILLTRIEDWERVARVHGELFGEASPACTVVQVVRFRDRRLVRSRRPPSLKRWIAERISSIAASSGSEQLYFTTSQLCNRVATGFKGKSERCFSIA